MDVDVSRRKLIDSLNNNQKDMYIIGMCYHSAFMSYLERERGKRLSLTDDLELKAVIYAMNRQKLKSEINT